MKKKLTFSICTLAALLFMAQPLSAQTTHAHSSAQQWKGIDVLDVLANPGNYPGVTGDGIPVYLYNVGTGRFAVDGGDYGMEARLFYEDFGRQLRLRIMDGVLKIDPTIAEASSSKYLLTCNVPGITRDPWSLANTFSPTTIFDGYYYWGKWNFQRIDTEDSESEFHTYYMYQQHNEGTAYSNAKNKTYQGADIRNLIIRFGAAYGEYCSDGTTEFKDKNGNVTGTNTKGCGYYVHLDDDRSVWTTAGNANNSEQSPWGNTTTVEVNGDQVKIDELYQWRIISEAEFEQVLEQEVQGINPSISSLIPDRDFTRNSNDFFPYWTTTAANSTTPAEGEGRKGYSWGNWKKNTTQQNDRYLDEAWDSPVRLKKVFNDLKEAKFGFMSFEGIGSIHTTFELPHGGWYQIECRAISFAPSDHPAYMYAHTGSTEPGDEIKNSDIATRLGYGQEELPRFDNPAQFKALYPQYAGGSNKSQKALNLCVGKVLTFDEGVDYTRKFWIYISPEKYAADKNLTIGFRKTAATKTFSDTKDEVDYYYDNDWICVDDIKMSYMGAAPAFLYEDSLNLNYLIYDANKINERPSASPDSHYSGALSLKRTLNKGQWNAFSLPIPLTGEQVRLAFGEEAQLLKLDGIGTLSLNTNVIDFRTVELKPEDPLETVVEPGRFYLLKPTIDPVEGKDPHGNDCEYYELGRNFFSVDLDDRTREDYEHYVLDANVWGNHQSISSYNGGNDGTAYVSYVKTPGYSSFAVNSSGEYQGETPDTLYVPGSNGGTYAVSGGTIAEVNRDMRIKGFRGWIILDHSIFDDPEEQNAGETAALRIGIDGVVDGAETTGIMEQIAVPVRLSDDTAVYDLLGRRVGTLGAQQLPKGIYIVRGKKFYVK